MKPATLKRYQALLNIGLKRSKQQVRPIDHNIRYMNPEHTVMVDVIHHANKDIGIKESYEGATELYTMPKTPFEPADPMKVYVSRDYLKSIVDNFAPGTVMSLTVGTDYPLKLEGLLDVETEARAWIAPRIEEV